jgi:hypothetical protein
MIEELIQRERVVAEKRPQVELTRVNKGIYEMEQQSRNDMEALKRQLESSAPGTIY